jgi:TolA-binding protein
MEYCLIALGREAEAVEILQNYIEKNPDSRFTEGLAFKKADMFYSGKRYKDAVAEYDAFINKYPDSDKVPEVLYQKAKSYISMNDKPEAVKTLDRIVAEYPKSEYAPIAILDQVSNARKLCSGRLRASHIEIQHGRYFKCCGDVQRCSRCI